MVVTERTREIGLRSRSARRRDAMWQIPDRIDHASTSVASSAGLGSRREHYQPRQPAAGHIEVWSVALSDDGRRWPLRVSSDARRAPRPIEACDGVGRNMRWSSSTKSRDVGTPSRQQAPVDPDCAGVVIGITSIVGTRRSSDSTNCGLDQVHRSHDFVAKFSVVCAGLREAR